MCGACNDPRGIVTSRPTAYDLKTGELIKTIPQVLSKPMGHDRCYRDFITERFFINSKTGGPDCMNLKTNAEYPTAFTRATCSVGPLPCNGLGGSAPMPPASGRRRSASAWPVHCEMRTCSWSRLQTTSC